VARGDEPLLEVRDLVVEYRSGRHAVRAVDGVDLEVGAGEVLGVVGESGSGKTSLGSVVAGFLRPTSGSVVWRGGRGPATRVGRPGVQMIFQESATALDPRLPAWKSVAEALARGGSIGGRLREPAVRHLERVGLTAAHADQRPRALSGGERQRVAIARALAAEASLIVCDEAVSSLDVSVRAVVLDLLASLRRETGIALFFITHDVSVVGQLADRVAVMRRGRVVECGPTRRVLFSPGHEYTVRLIGALPSLERPALGTA
jgi:ABC-type glutathione transport system ATPase component